MQKNGRREFLVNSARFTAGATAFGATSLTLPGLTRSAWAGSDVIPGFPGARIAPLEAELSAADLAKHDLQTPEAAYRLDGAQFGAQSLPDAEVDVVILGAGFAGLTAALQVQASGKSFLLIEARDRIGGRTFSKRYGKDLVMDEGGQWIGVGQTHLQALADRFGAETFKTYDQGLNVLDTQDRIHTYTGALPGFRQLEFTAADFAQVWYRLDRLAKQVPLENPWDAAKALDWDSITLGDWVRRNCVFAKIASLMKGALQMVFAGDLDQISLLYALFYIHSCGGLDSLTQVTGGAQERRFKHGTGDLAHRMAAGFADRVVFSSPVRSVLQTGGKVEIKSDRIRVTASRVICALPPSTIKDVDFGSGVSAQRKTLMKLMPMGQTIKVKAVYEKPFWRETGFSGQAFASHLPITSTYDNSVDGNDRGVLLGFYVGPQASVAHGSSRDQRREEFLRYLGLYFGPAAMKPLLYHEQVWKDEDWSQGCYGASAPMGLWSQIGSSLRAASGLVHWAGTETAEVWSGYIEGAVRSGERAAQEVLSSL